MCNTTTEVPFIEMDFMPGSTHLFSLRNLTAEDVLLLSIALKPSREEIARRLDDLRDPTIRTFIEMQGCDPQHDIQHIMERLMIISKALSGSPKKLHL